MNKTITKISFAVFSVLALMLSQFWSCSTAQTINYVGSKDNSSINKQEPQAEKGSSVLLFKLLTPIVPKDGPQIAQTNFSDATSLDAYATLITSYTTYFTVYSTPKVDADRFYYNHDNSSYSLEYAADIQSRGPPYLV